MDFEDNQEKNDFGKAPFYTGAFFILIVIAIFAFVSFQEEGNLDHWVIVSCLLGSGLIAVLLFLPHFFQSILIDIKDLNDRADSDLASKAFFELKEVRSDLDALAVKIDKVPTLVNKIVAESMSSESTAPVENLINNFNELKYDIVSKLEKIEESESPLIDPNHHVEKLFSDIQKISTNIDLILTKLPPLDLLNEKHAKDSKEEEISDLHLDNIQDIPNAKVIEEAISGMEEETSEKVFPFQENPEQTEQVLDESEGSQPTETNQKEPPSEEITPSTLEENAEETKDSEPSISVDKLAEDDSNENDKDTFPKIETIEQSNQELDLGLPDPAETLRKVDALLAGEDAATLPIKPVPIEDKKEKNGTTTVVANVMIGIGNKPYLRGEGPGLSWDEGVSMNFVEIGKWAWSPTRKNAPLTVQVYRNDQDPDKGGKIEVKPGQRLEITPEFS